MSIVAGGSAKASIIVQTREYKVEDFAAGQGVGLAQQMQGGQSPVEAVEAQMLCEPVLQLVFALGRVSADLGS